MLVDESKLQDVKNRPESQIGNSIRLGEVNDIHRKAPKSIATSRGMAFNSTGDAEGAVVEFDALAPDDVIAFGTYKSISSTSQGIRHFADVKYLGTGTLGDVANGTKLWIRGRVAGVRMKGKGVFLVIRADAFYTIQACHFIDSSNPDASKGLIDFISSLSHESIVDIQGTLVSAKVKSCTQHNVELQIKKAFVVSRAPSTLPFLLEDAARSEEDVETTKDSSRPMHGVSQDIRLDNRWLDLRVPANNAIMRIRSGVSRLFRDSLYDSDFVEINTPKLIPGQSEGGSDVFTTDYFGQTACLAQSPQLYKQMAISGDLKRVFEIGPVFRAEKSRTKRHLCEFTGLDIEMEIKEHYNEALSVIHRLFKDIFTGLEEKYAKELSVVRQQFPSSPVRFTPEPLVIHWREGIDMLRGSGVVVGDYDDLSTPQELKLGELVRQKYGSDFFILHQYPTAVRPFYTMVNPIDPKYSNSYDIFLRGQEICSGAQRCHDPVMLEAAITARGIDPSSLKYYVESFRHGISPHAGAGIGLDRVVFLYLGKLVISNDI
jgi:aspartyl-tRNA synthetase